VAYGAEGSPPTLTLTFNALSAPGSAAVGAVTTSSIVWNWGDIANEDGFRVYDASSGGTNKSGNLAAGTVSWTETGLSPNTSYTRYPCGYSFNYEGPRTALPTTVTLSVPPSTSTVTCDKPTGPSQSPHFTFTAVGGFGAGTVQYYRYVWDQSPTHTWTDSEPQWSSGTLPCTATSDGDWYLHVKGYNSADVANGTLDLGPYSYEAGPVIDKIGLLWSMADGTNVRLEGKPVTAAMSDAFYVEETDRSAGIKVVSNAHVVVKGDLVNVAGTLGVSGSERALFATSVTPVGTASVPKPLAMGCDKAGGMSPSAATPGTTDGRGLYNVGLLARVCGSVSYSNTDDPQDMYFYVDDGSGVWDGSGHAGVMVRCGSVTPPASGFAAATGVVSLETPVTKTVAVLIIRDSDDIKTF